MHRTWKSCLTGCLLLFPGLSWAGDLFSPCAGAGPEGTPSLRSRLVRANLEELPAPGVPGQAIVFNLWDDTTLTGVVERIEPTDGGRVLSGSLAEEADGTFIAVARDDVLVAEVRSPSHGAWYIHPVGGQQHAVRQIDWERFDVCATNDLAPVTPRGGGHTVFGTRSTPIITVMIVYTDQARTGAGGQAGIDALIDMAISQANQVYAN